mgnify:FL=1
MPPSTCISPPATFMQAALTVTRRIALPSLKGLQPLEFRADPDSNFLVWSFSREFRSSPFNASRSLGVALDASPSTLESFIVIFNHSDRYCNPDKSLPLLKDPNAADMVALADDTLSWKKHCAPSLDVLGIGAYELSSTTAKGTWWRRRRCSP